RALDVSQLRVRLPFVGPQRLYWGPGVSYSPDGARIAEGSSDGSVRVIDAHTGRIVRRIVIGSEAPIVQYSPDGSVIAVAAGSGLFLVDPRTGTIRRRAKPPGYAMGAGDLSFTADGSALYLADGTAVVRWDVRANRIHVIRRGPIDGVGGPPFGLYFA